MAVFDTYLPRGLSLPRVLSYTVELREGAKGAFTTSLPKFLESGDVARLIPVVADGRREQRVVSVFLATLSAVPEFAQPLLSSVGVRLGKRSLIDTDAEVLLTVPKDTKDRPDGLIAVSAGNESWEALIEAKIESSDLDEEPVHRYLQLARECGVDAVIYPIDPVCGAARP